MRRAIAAALRRLADRISPLPVPAPPIFEAQLCGMPRIDGLRMRIAEGSRTVVIPEVRAQSAVAAMHAGAPPTEKDVLRHLFVRREPVVFDYAGVEQHR